MTQKKLELIIIPNGWPVPLGECPPGHFVYNDNLCFKSEYLNDIYCESGEAFWAGADTPEERDKILVQPVEAVWRCGDDQ